MSNRWNAMPLLFICAIATGASPAGDHSDARADHYFRMKQVKILDPGMNQMPAIDLMIPTAWQFRGDVRWGGSIGGCFADAPAVSLHAESADGAVVFEGIPNFTWQFADDPNTTRALVQENQQGTKVGLKPCPVIKPMRAAEFLQQLVMPKFRTGKRIVSVEQLPEFEQMVRQRIGLPPVGSAQQGPIRTDAARVRLEYDVDGKTVEEWFAAALVVRIIPAGPSNSYDCHAIMLLSMRAPKGQLDGNDKLFKLIASTVRREPKWGAQVDSQISMLYQKKREEEAKRSAILAAFQQHVADTINDVTANQMRGANASAFAADQNIRGVQTFRDPTTGGTLELSNLYDHAWLNGTNEYVMSDEPNFNPNGHLNGSWTSLQPVRPQP